MAASELPIPKLGPDPVLISRKEVDMLYEILQAVVRALSQLGVDYLVTGGSLLGAVRQHSILFCDDDIDIAIIENDCTRSSYDRTAANLQQLLGEEFVYIVRPWEGGDRVRSKAMPTVFLDLFTIRRYETMDQLKQVLGVKKNGKPQSAEYVQGIVDKIETSAFSQNEKLELEPFWHFNTRKAVEMWPKEVYRDREMMPLAEDLKFGPLSGVKGPRTPVRLLKRAFGLDCFEVYYQSASHKNVVKPPPVGNGVTGSLENKELQPLILGGGAWEGGRKAPLAEEHYLPLQPTSRAMRRPTIHCKHELFVYLEQQSAREREWVDQAMDRPCRTTVLATPKGCTVYMDGVFDLFHIGHLEAIRRCAELGDRVIIGVTGDADAADYKRPPIISEANRVAVVAALREVAYVVCPCPLVVTEEFMSEHGIDQVVHGFANDADALRQEDFFATPMKLGKFKRIPYYQGLSTTDIINKIRALPVLDESN